MIGIYEIVKVGMKIDFALFDEIQWVQRESVNNNSGIFIRINQGR